MRAALPTLAPAQSVEAAEHLDQLEGEMKADVPRQSRIKSALLGLWSVVGNVTDFASSVLTIAQAYGIDAETLKRLTPGV
jgi:hypothetical protein